MAEKVGRNDPCPCGSGKKYKACCLKKETSATYTPSGKRKFTAKVLSGGGVAKAQPQKGAPVVDYNMLMERSFGEAIHSDDEKPPQPADPLQYLPKKGEKSKE